MERKLVNCKIIVVDDEKSLRFTTSQALVPLGCQVETAASGEEALTRLDDPELKVMILDLKLPGQNGLVVLRQVKSRRPDLKVIMVTAFGGVEEAVAALKLGAFDFIQKPLPPKLIRRLVERALAGTEPFDLAPPAGLNPDGAGGAVLAPGQGN